MDAMSGLTDKKLLVVDDDEKLRNLLKEYLEDYASDATAAAGNLLIAKELAGVSDDRGRETILKKLQRIEKGQRDIYC